MNEFEALQGDVADIQAANTVKITIPYSPRKHFRSLHNSPKRFKFVVAHRRAGKSVSCINELIKKALQNTRQYPPPRYAYVGPSFAQTKDLIWGYAKHYTSGFKDMEGYNISEGDLTITLPNGASIALYGGAAAWERMRGLYFDGIVLDEFAMLNPAVFSTVVRPCLADYRGWAIVSGTSNGDDHFHEQYKKALLDPELWDIFVLPVTDTDALHPDEVIEMTKDMTPEEFAREMLCSFNAPIEGAYYASAINDAELAKPSRVTKVPYDTATGVFTWWDLGIDDAMAVWFIQRVGAALHVINYKEWVGKGLDTVSKDIKALGYDYTMHVLPHDIKARELSSGRSRYDILSELLGHDLYICPMHRVEDGIAAVRSILPMVWFDKEATAEGRSALRNYQRSKMGRPVHNWASHGADAFRTGAVALSQTIGYISQSGGRSRSSRVPNTGGGLRRRIRGTR